MRKREECETGNVDEDGKGIPFSELLIQGPKEEFAGNMRSLYDLVYNKACPALTYRRLFRPKPVPKSSSNSKPVDLDLALNYKYLMEDYKELNFLGRGSFGSVSLCEKIETKEKVAIKKIDLKDEKSKEVQLFSRLNHHHIIRYINHFKNKLNLFIVMEYATGGTLEELLKKYKIQKDLTEIDWSTKNVTFLWCQIVSGLKYLHEIGIVHGDLVSRNILVTGRNNWLKISDFSCSGRKEFLSFGTCAPEILRGQSPSFSSDIWALGVLLYECATFKEPFRDELNIDDLGSRELLPYKFSRLEKLCRIIFQIDPTFRPDCCALEKHLFLQGAFISYQFELYK